MLKKEFEEQLVSIIMPAYNSARFITEAIESVIAQTYTCWELLVVDDCSIDTTAEIVIGFSKLDNRINYYKLETNSGAAMARNAAITMAKGKYIAFLDSDDIWKEEKLSTQINFMIENNYNFTCTTRDVIDEYSNSINKCIGVKSRVSYTEMLLMCPIGNSTVVYNCEETGKIYAPNVNKSNDYALWLKILKKEKYVFGLKKNLGSGRVVKNSLSSNKFGKIKAHWLIYKKFEKFSNIKSLIVIFSWVVIKIFKLKKILYVTRA